MMPLFDGGCRTACSAWTRSNDMAQASTLLHTLPPVIQACTPNFEVSFGSRMEMGAMMQGTTRNTNPTCVGWKLNVCLRISTVVVIIVFIPQPELNATSAWVAKSFESSARSRPSVFPFVLWSSGTLLRKLTCKQ